MKTLVLDTTHKYLIIGCLEDDTCLSSVSELAWKRQSERFFPALEECMNKAGWQSEDIQQVVVTTGPGSYTGERIAMTFAKVFCTQAHVDLYTLSTFLIYAGQKDCMVMLDARSNRAYCGICKDAKLLEENIKTLDEIRTMENIEFVGDTELIEKESQDLDFIQNIIDVRSSWEKVDNVHTLTPHYLKSKEELVQ